MKKHFVYFLSLLICTISCLGLTGCGSSNVTTSYLVLDEHNVGDYLNDYIYPNAPTAFKTTYDESEYTINLTSFTLQYIAKNEITEDTVIDSGYYRYTLQVIIDGNTNISLAGKYIRFYFCYFNGTINYENIKIEDLGTFHYECLIKTNSNICPIIVLTKVIVSQQVNSPTL